MSASPRALLEELSGLPGTHEVRTEVAYSVEDVEELGLDLDLAGEGDSQVFRLQTLASGNGPEAIGQRP